MAIQMGIVIGAGAYGGNALDSYYNNEKPTWAIIFSLLGVGISLYLFIKQAKKLSEDD